MRVCVRACVCVCVRACVRACVMLVYKWKLAAELTGKDVALDQL